MFVPLKYNSTDCDYINCDDVTENGTYYFSKMDTDSDYGTVELTIEATTDSDVYVYITSPEIENVNYYFSNEANTYQNINEPYIMDLGKHKKGEKITVSLDCGSIDANESYFEIYAYSIDKNVLDSAYDFLNAGKLNVTSYSDNRVSAVYYSCIISPFVEHTEVNAKLCCKIDTSVHCALVGGDNHKVIRVNM